MLERLARALDARDATLARSLLDGLRAQRGERDANVRLSGARLARLEGRDEEALAALAALAAELPRQAPVCFHFAHALEHAGRHDEAGRWYLQAARLWPELLEATHRALQCAAHGTRDWPRLAPEDGRELISFVVCSIDAAKLAALRSNLDALLAGTAWELVHIPDARSLAEGYTRGLDRARGERVVLCHDDIRLLAPDFRARLLAHLERFDLLGVAGSTLCNGPAVFWAGVPHAQGWVAYPDDAGTQPTISGTRGPVVAGAQALDGLFLAARRELFSRLAFDAETFDGFHFYDLDFSLRAHRAGARVGIAGDLLVEHASRGGFGAEWQRYAERFLAKFPELRGTAATSLPFIFPAPAGDDAHALRVHAALMHWIPLVDEALA